jgi:hypothetical protein
MLKFQNGNKKLAKGIYTFSLPAGHSCPFANNCLSKADRETGKITDGDNTEFRCFAAMAESTYTNVRNARWHNYDLLKPISNNVDKMAELINNSLPKKATMIRVHVSGDFFNQTYFDAWMQVAMLNPDKLFYAYTKSIKYWMDRQDCIPSNFKLTASFGGKLDNLIEENNLKAAKVVYSKQEAEDLGLFIDKDDSLAYGSDNSFALLIHGVQKAGSKASKAVQLLKTSA